MAGPYVKQGALVSTPYNTISMLRTMEEILGLEAMNLNDAAAKPMADIFDPGRRTWSFTATPSAMLYNSTLPLPPRQTKAELQRPTHDAAYWAKVTEGMDFSTEDRVDPARLNEVLWRGIMGNRPYPAIPTGLDLRKNRKELLDGYGAGNSKLTGAETTASPS